MSEAKRMRISGKKKPVLVFGTAPDRFLLIEDIIFHVESDKLIQLSEYFRAMFTSAFKEKEKQQVEINFIKAADAKMFMRSVFQLSSFHSHYVDLESFINTCAFFQANEYLVTLFQMKPKYWIEKLSAPKIIQMTIEHGLIELKDAVESFLASNFSVRMKLKRKYTGKDCDFEFDELVISSLELTSEFGLAKLKDVVDKYLTVQYYTSGHQFDIEDKYINIMGTYQLEQLKVPIERYAISIFEERTNNGIMEKYYDTILSRYYSSAKPMEMDQLKKTVEYYLLAKGMEDDGYISGCWNIIRRFHSSERYYPLSFIRRPKEIEKDFAVLGLSNLMKDICEHGLDRIKLKEKIEDYFIAEFENIEAEEARKLINDLLNFAKHSSTFKSRIEAHLFSEYKRGQNGMATSMRYFSDYDISRTAFTYGLEELKTYIENIHVAHFKRSKTNLREYLNLLMNYDMPLLKAAVEQYFMDRMKTEDVDATFIEHCCELSSKYNLDQLKTAVEQHFIDKLKADDIGLSCIEECYKYSYEYNMDQLEDAIESYLVSDFEATRNFKHVHYAFDRYSGLEIHPDAQDFCYLPLEKFTDSVTAFLSKSNTNDPVIQAGREYIFSLPPDAQITIFKCLLRKPEEK